jgi:nondiscriminating glutamyl-tRNA synthetase
MIHPTPRLRFAPSPTGPLHLGGARTALYNWAAARAMGGAFLLRIEDTDRARSTEESLRVILEGLRWLGIDWDEGPEADGGYGPYFQSQRLSFYRQAADRLLGSGLAYPCYCTPEEVEAGRRALQAQGRNPTYDRRCRDLGPDQRMRREAEGRTASVRFRMPEERTVVVHDLVRGRVEVNTRELDDWVMLRPDGMPLYNFACVVDDRQMRITHVVRGEEHFLNGIKQVLLFEALGAEPPQYAHIPLILNKDGKKLSKRDADTNMLDYRDKGFPADAVFNYIALLGWGFSADRDVFTRDEMVQRFRIGDIGKAGARFDEDKLRWMCGDYLRRMAPDQLLREARAFLSRAVPERAWDSHPAWLRNLVACYQERVQLYSELPDKLGWAFAGLPDLDEAAQRNLARHPDAGRWLLAYADLLEQSDLPPSYPADRSAADAAVRLPTRKDQPTRDAPCATPADLEADCRRLAGRLGVEFGDLVHPIRAALTGTDKGPGLFDIVFLLGQPACGRRLRARAG